MPPPLPPPRPPPGRYQPPPPPEDDDDDDAPPPDDEYDEDDDDDGPPPSDDDDDGPPPSDDDDDGPPPSDDDDDAPPPPSDDDEDNGDDESVPPPPDGDDISPPGTPSGSEKSPPPSEMSSPPMSEGGPPPSDDSFSDASSEPPSPPTMKKPPAPPKPPIANDRKSVSSILDINAIMQKSQMSFGANSSAIPPADDIDMDILSKGFSMKAKTFDDSDLKSVPTPLEIGSRKSFGSNNNNNNSNNNTTFVSTNPNSRASTIQVSNRNAEQAAVVAAEALAAGYVELLGKFDGDVFEKLFVKAERNYMYIRTEYGEDMKFDLIDEIFVFEDPQDFSCFVIEVKHEVLIFKMRSPEERNKLLSMFPQKVFEASEDEVNYSEVANNMIEDEKKMQQQLQQSKVDKTYKYPDEDNGRHRKGQSVEDLLEGSSTAGVAAAANNRKIDKLIFSSNQNQIQNLQANLVRPARDPLYRKELLSEKLKQPIYSTRRVKMITKWINGLYFTTKTKVNGVEKEIKEHIWPTLVTINTLNKDFCNGILLSRIMKLLIPEAEAKGAFLHLNEKTVAPKAALENLDKVLGLILRSKNVNKSRIPQAKDILNGDTSKIVVLLQELFDVYVRDALYKRAPTVLKWFSNILRHYDNPKYYLDTGSFHPPTLRLSDNVFNEGDLGSVWAHFQSGLALFCVIYYLFGQNTIGTGTNTIAIDPFRVFSNPSSISEFRQNMIYVFKMFRLLNVEIIWEFDDWVTFPDTEFCLLQLCYIYDVLKTNQCSLPPAQSGMAGISSGPNGEPRVTGLNFADSIVSQSFSLPKITRGVLLGAGEDALALLPIDTTGRNNNRYFSDIIPQGLVSANVKVVHKALKLKETSKVAELNGWKSSSQIESISLKETKKDKALIEVLKETHVQTRRLSSKAGKVHRQNVDNLDLAINTFIQNHEVDLLDDHSAINQQSTVELDEMMRVLEEHMLHSNLEMSRLEEELTSRYIELEQLAEDLTEDEYVQELDILEEERLKLEEEKLKLQDHFELRLNSIKTRQLEIKVRSDSAKEALSNLITGQDAITDANTAVNASSSKSIRSTSSRPSVKKPNEETTKESMKKRAEGWINLTTKSKFFNHHMKTQHERSENKLKEQWLPERLKQKLVETQTKGVAQKTHQNDENYKPNPNFQNQKFNASSMDSSLFNAGGPSNFDFHFGLSTLDNELAKNDPIYAMFNRFRFRLLEVSNKWNENQGKQRDSVFGNTNQPRSVHFQDFIALPDSNSGVDVKNAIRAEELAQMTLEDERRRGWYKQVEQMKQIGGAAMNSTGASLPQVIHAISRPVLATKQSNCKENIALQNASNQNERKLQIAHLVADESNNNNNRNKPLNGTSSNSNNLIYSNNANGSSKSNSNISYNYDNQSNNSGMIGDDQDDGNYGTSIDDEFNNGDNGSVSVISEGMSDFEISAATRWLSMKRPLILCDRKNKEFTWVTEKSKVGKKVSISLSWFDGDFLVGALSYADIKGVVANTQDNTLFSLSLSESPKALKATGGRAKLTLKCGSSGECVKYVQSIRTVLHALHLGLIKDQ